jgi:hypothetical protein
MPDSALAILSILVGGLAFTLGMYGPDLRTIRHRFRIWRERRIMRRNYRDHRRGPYRNYGRKH